MHNRTSFVTEQPRPIGLSRRTLGAAIAGSIMLAGRPAFAQNSYPDRPIRIVVPYSPGGGTDLIARGLAQRFQIQMGQPGIVDNRAGASGIIGCQYVMQQPADGYTLLIGATTTHSIIPVLYKKPPFDPLKDFAPVSLLATMPHVLVVATSLPIHNVAEFRAYAKAHPGLAYGSAGVGSPHHLAGEMLKSSMGLDLVHIPYKGTAPALADVMGGQIGFISIEYTAALEQIKAGKVRPIAVAAKERIPGFDVPTFAEQGMPEFVVSSWYAMYAPAKTPQLLVQKLSKEVADGLNSPELRDRLNNLGAKPVGSTPEQLFSYNKQQLNQWAKVVKISGATADI